MKAVSCGVADEQARVEIGLHDHHDPVAVHRALRAFPRNDVVLDRDRAVFQRFARERIAEGAERLQGPDAEALVALPLAHARFAGRTGGPASSSASGSSIPRGSSGLSSATRTFPRIAAGTAAVCVSPKGFARSK